MLERHFRDLNSHQLTGIIYWIEPDYTCADNAKLLDDAPAQYYRFRDLDSYCRDLLRPSSANKNTNQPFFRGRVNNSSSRASNVQVRPASQSQDFTGFPE